MIRAQDIMTRNAMSLKVNLKVSEAVQIMLNHHISSAPVVKLDGSLAGQISEIFLLKLFILSSQKGNEGQTLNHHLQSLSQVMTVQERDPIDEVVKKIIASPSHRVLVLNAHKRLTGIISPKDILRFLVGEKSRAGSLLEEFSIMQDRLKILKDQLHSTQSQLDSVSTVLDQSAFMFYSMDKDENILIGNEQLHKELEYKSGELVGKKLKDLVSQDSYKQASAETQLLVGGQEEVKSYTTYLKKNGMPLRVEVVSRSIIDEEGNFLATSTMSKILDSEELLRALHGVYGDSES